MLFSSLGACAPSFKKGGSVYFLDCCLLDWGLVLCSNCIRLWREGFLILSWLSTINWPFSSLVDFNTDFARISLIYWALLPENQVKPLAFYIWEEDGWHWTAVVWEVPQFGSYYVNWCSLIVRKLNVFRVSSEIKCCLNL